MFGIDDMAIATLAGGALSSAGQIYANNKNIQFAQGNNESQIHLADTAHQREVRDLLAAGLNPVLSASGSGSPVPQLGSPDIGNPGQGLSDGISSAAKVLSDEYKANVDLLRQNVFSTELTNSAARLDLDVKRIENQGAIEMAKLKRDALLELAGWNIFDDHGKRIAFQDKEKRARLVNILKDGFESDAKMQSNANWRANLSSFVDVISTLLGAMPQKKVIERR